MTVVLNRAIAEKVLDIVGHGLVAGIGKPKLGQMCVEAAVCLALGEPHGDQPSCVGSAVRMFKIRLNDKNWSSNAARAQGLRRVAVAQLGSDALDQREFARGLVVCLTQTVIAGLPRLAPELAQRCRDVRTFSEAHALLKEVRAPADADDAAYAAAYAYAAADAAAYAAAYAAADAAAYAAAYAAAAAAYAAADAAAARSARRDYVLSLAAECAVSVLQQMGCKGCEWLDLA